MEAKIGKLLDSVGNFFTGADQIPWCDGDIVAVSAFPTLNSIWVSDFVLSLFFFLGIEFRLDFGFFCGFFFSFFWFFSGCCVLGRIRVTYFNSLQPETSFSFYIYSFAFVLG